MNQLDRLPARRESIYAKTAAASRPGGKNVEGRTFRSCPLNLVPATGIELAGLAALVPAWRAFFGGRRLDSSDLRFLNLVPTTGIELAGLAALVPAWRAFFGGRRLDSSDLRFLNLVPTTGIEPATSPLPRVCSTD